VKKRAFGLKWKTCGIFAKDWPEWLKVEGDFHLDLEWMCASEATFVANLVRTYPNTTFNMWKPDMILPPVNFVNKIWHCEVLEALLASAEKFRYTKAWGWKLLLFLSSTLTLAAVRILLELLESLSGRYLGWWI
jgi:hypothetical protein